MKKISINIGRCEEETKGGREKSQPSNRKNRKMKRKKRQSVMDYKDRAIEANFSFCVCIALLLID